MKDKTKKLLDTIKECLEKIRDLEENIYVTACIVNGTGWVEAQLNNKTDGEGHMVFEYHVSLKKGESK